MRFLLIAVVLATAFLGSSAAFAAGLPMTYELRPHDKANLVLERLIKDSLRKDPGGNAVIAGSKCTTPNHFLRAIQEYHPEVEMENAEELPAFIRGLVRKPAPQGAGEQRMSRIIHKKSNGTETCSLDLDGWARAFKAGEYVWVDPNSGNAILSAECRNVVAQSAPTQPRSRVIIPEPEQAFRPVPIQKATAEVCPMGRSVYYHVWPLSKIPPDLREEVGLFSSRAEEFVTEDVSRTLGQKFRELHAAGKLPRASGTHPLEVRWIKVSQNGYMGYGTDVVDVTDASTVVIRDGLQQEQYSPELFENRTLSVVVPPDDVDRYKSASFGDNGKRELRSFPTERLHTCSTHVHLIDRTQ